MSESGGRAPLSAPISKRGRLAVSIERVTRQPDTASTSQRHSADEDDQVNQPDRGDDHGVQLAAPHGVAGEFRMFTRPGSFMRAL